GEVRVGIGIGASPLQDRGAYAGVVVRRGTRLTTQRALRRFGLEELNFGVRHDVRRRLFSGRRAERSVYGASRIEDGADARRRIEERRYGHVVEAILKAEVLRWIVFRRLRENLHARIAERVQRV